MDSTKADLGLNAPTSTSTNTSTPTSTSIGSGRSSAFKIKKGACISGWGGLTHRGVNEPKHVVVAEHKAVAVVHGMHRGHDVPVDVDLGRGVWRV